MKNRTILGLNINIILLGIVSFLNDLSSEMILPLLPILIKSMGGNGLIIGLIGGLKEFIENILKVFSGYFSDKIHKRKIFIFSGYFLSSIFKSLLYLCTNWIQLLSIISFERLGKGLREAPRDAMLSTYSLHKGLAFGFHKTMDTLGAINGSILTFLLFWFWEFDIKIIIIIAAIISFFSLIPLFFVQEQKQITTISLIKDYKISSQLKIFLIISGIFALSNFSYMFFILRAQKYFSDKLEIGVPIFLYVLFNIFYATFATPIGILSDKIGRKKILSTTYFLFSLICLGFFYAKNLYSLIILFILYGIFQAALDSNQKAFVSDLSDEKIRATALGFFHTINGIALFFASLIAGFLWQTIGSNAIFIYASSLSCLSAILFLGSKKL